jgi:hypothetical protein
MDAEAVSGVEQAVRTSADSAACAEALRVERDVRAELELRLLAAFRMA